MHISRSQNISLCPSQSTPSHMWLVAAVLDSATLEFTTLLLLAESWSVLEVVQSSIVDVLHFLLPLVKLKASEIARQISKMKFHGEIERGKCGMVKIF